MRVQADDRGAGTLGRVDQLLQRFPGMDELGQGSGGEHLGVVTETPAGVDVPLTLMTPEGVQETTVRSADRYDFLKIRSSY